MKATIVVASGLASMLAACMAVAQTPVLGNIESPYPALQSRVQMAGNVYGLGWLHMVPQILNNRLSRLSCQNWPKPDVCGRRRIRSSGNRLRRAQGDRNGSHHGNPI